MNDQEISLDELLAERAKLRERLIAAVPEPDLRFAAILGWIPIETLREIARIWEQ